MNNSSPEVPLQPSIEKLITKICSEKCLQPPDPEARRSLSTITEASAIEILTTIAASSSQIRSLTGYIIYMVKNSSGAVCSPNGGSILPQKRSPPPSATAGSPQKYAYDLSPNSKQFGCSPGSGFKSRTIPEYFSASPNDGYGSLVSKQVTSYRCSGLKDGNYDTATCHLGESSKATHRVQKQLIFSQGCNFEDAEHGKVRQNLFDSSNGGHHFSVVQKQHTLSPCSSSKVASPKQLPDFKSSTYNGLSSCEGFGGSNCGNIEPKSCSMTQIRSDSSHSTSNLPFSHQSLLLAELEFRKLFMVHSYIGRKRLEDVVSVDDAIEITKTMKTMTMFNFEAKMWAKYGRRFCEPSDRAMHFDWDSGKTYLYHCYVSVDGTHQFKGPHLNTRRTHLQRELGDDNVLIVQFTDDPETSDMPSNCCNWSAAYQTVAGGISIGLRHYRLFAFKDGRDGKNIKVQNTKKLRSSWSVKCYFIRKESHAPWAEKDPYILFQKTSHEARCLFMHVHMVSSMAKYISRCSLALSNTIKLRVDLASVHVEGIEDIFCRDENGFVVCDEDGEELIHTDGTGFISEDLAILCARDFIEAKDSKDDSYEFIDLLKLEQESLGDKGRETCIREPPLLVQCRLFKDGYAVKGTLLVNKKLKARTIQIRRSMIKVENDPSLTDSTSFSSLEIVSISRKPRKANLSKNLIALLNVGGVPNKIFFQLLDDTWQDTQKVSSSVRAAVRVGLNYGQMDDSATSVAMIGSGIPLNEPYLQYRLGILAVEERKGLRGGKIPINESYYLIGTADPTGTLNSDEVCVILENGQLSGKVLVYRNPGLHFGDIHVLNAKYVEELEQFVGNAKYGIFFSTKGRRSVGSEIANGDFDGDLYWVSKNTLLLHHFKVSEPWVRIHSTPNAPSKKPSELSQDELENELFTLLFASQKQNNVAGKAADSWLTFMDQYLSLGENETEKKHRIKEKLLRLVDLYYDALDAPKSGKMVDIPISLLPQKFPHFLEKTAAKTYSSTSVLGEIYNKVIEYQPDNALLQDIPKLPCFNVEIPEASLNLWKERYRLYRLEMSDALSGGDESKKDAANIVIKKYKQMLYEANDFATSNRKIEDIYNDALAIYHANYDYAKTHADVRKCGFAWKVAGEALCSFHEMKTPGRSIPFKVAVLSTFI